MLSELCVNFPLSVHININLNLYICICLTMFQMFNESLFCLFYVSAPNDIEATAHPIHLHGHSFYVVKVGYPVYDNGTKR